MTTFIILAAALVVLALLMLAPSLLRARAPMALDRNQQNVVIAQERLSELETELKNGTLSQSEFDQSKLELEQALLLDIKDEESDSTHQAPKQHGHYAMGALALLVPALTVGLYLFLGEPRLIDFKPEQRQAQTEAAGHGSEKLPPVEDMVSSLESHLKEQPDDAEGWFLLGRTYMVMKDYPNAAKAFDSAHKLVGDIPSAMLSLADALAMSNNGNMAGRPTELVRRAVQIAPQDTTALWLAGLVERQAGNLEASLSHFESLKPLLANEPSSVAKIEGFIASLKQQLGSSTVQQPEAAPTTVSGPATAAAAIKVKVSLTPELQSLVSPDQLVFVYAKAMQGPAMPLAAAKFKVADLPVEVTLDDSSAMMPQMKLSGFDQVVVGARVSKSGDPIAKPGDINGEISPVDVQADAAVDVVINSIVQ